MLSKLNGEENYFTRICVGGLLNTRKLELAHLLLQDINMFHMHPNKMPNSNLDSNRFISAAVSNLASNDRKTKAHLALINEPFYKISTLLTPVSTSSQLKTTAIKNTVSLNKINTSQQAADELALTSYDEEVAGLSDLASFISYSSRKPNQTYLPIREENSTGLFQPTTETNRVKHNISFLKIDDNPKLNQNSLQSLHNGFTLVCILNENDAVQSSYLLNIRLESDNSTLIWSKPAWDIKNVWINPLNTIQQQQQQQQQFKNELSNTSVTECVSGALVEQNALPTTTSSVNQVARFRKNRPPLISAATTLGSNTGQSFHVKSENFFKKTLLTQFNSKNQIRQYNKKSRSLINRRKSAMLSSKNQDIANLMANNIVTNNEILNNNNNKSNSSSFNEANDLIFDQVDPNLIYSVCSLNKRYVHKEPVSTNDSYEGFLDLHSVKHISKGCLDAQLFSDMQQVASTYAINEFDQSNIICLVYGSTFSENK